jgi:hypothetical protein
MIETVRPGIDYVVKNQMRGYYSAAARNARLIEELYRLQGRAEQAKGSLKNNYAFLKASTCNSKQGEFCEA